MVVNNQRRTAPPGMRKHPEGAFFNSLAYLDPNRPSAPRLLRGTLKLFHV